MQTDVSDLRSTIVPKSDQLNAEQLLSGEMVITVRDVRAGSGDDQPISIHYDDDNGRPYKPCKTMRKLLIFAWGPDGRRWVGRSMTLYNDKAVRFGGETVGGIRISHLTDIDRELKVSLTATKGKKALHTIQIMAPPAGAGPANIDAAETVEALKEAFGTAYKATKAPAERARLKAAYDKRMAALTAQPFDLPAARKRIAECTDLAVLQLIGDEVQDMPDGPDRDAMLGALTERDRELAAPR